MTKEKIESQIDKLQSMSINAQRDIGAKIEPEIAQHLKDSCDKEIRELEEKLRNMQPQT